MGDASPGGVLHRSNAGRIGSVAGGGSPGVGRVEEYRASYLWSASHHAYFPAGGVDGVVVVPAKTRPVKDVGLSVVLPRDYVVNFAPRGGYLAARYYAAAVASDDSAPLGGGEEAFLLAEAEYLAVFAEEHFLVAAGAHLLPHVPQRNRGFDAVDPADTVPALQVSGVHVQHHGRRCASHTLRLHIPRGGFEHSA